MFRIKHKPYNPLKEIEQIEKHVQQFFHLRGMYALVIECHSPLVFRTFFPFVSSNENQSEEIDGDKAFKRNNVVLDYLHPPILTTSITIVSRPTFCRYIVFLSSGQRSGSKTKY